MCLYMPCVVACGSIICLIFAYTSGSVCPLSTFIKYANCFTSSVVEGAFCVFSAGYAYMRTYVACGLVCGSILCWIFAYTLSSVCPLATFIKYANFFASSVAEGAFCAVSAVYAYMRTYVACGLVCGSILCWIFAYTLSSVCPTSPLTKYASFFASSVADCGFCALSAVYTYLCTYMPCILASGSVLCRIFARQTYGSLSVQPRISVSPSRTRFTLAIFLVQVMRSGICDAVCPVCFGSLPSCDFATSSKCVIDTQVATNTAVIAGGAAAGLSLAAIIRARWMRIFSLSSINAISALAKREPPGTVFAHSATTTLKDVVAAIASGRYSLDLACMKYSELLDACDSSVEGQARAKKLERDLANLSLMSKTGTLSVGASLASGDQGGVFSFLWAKISAFVPKRGLDDKVSLTGSPSDSGSAAGSASTVFSAKLVRAQSFTVFAECLNLFIMFATALGLVSTVVITDFVQHIVFDTMSLRDYPWQVAQELFILTLRRIEDSGKKLHFVNVLDQIYLPTVMEHAIKGAKEAYPEEMDAFFCRRGGIPLFGGTLRVTTDGGDAEEEDGGEDA